MTAEQLPKQRVTSIDFVRGVAMIVMALDHVRVFSGIPAGGQAFSLFFTRWITNFSAPAFVLLAGMSACLYGLKVRRLADLSRFLMTRGLWLIVLELSVVRICWTFNFDFQHYFLAGVLWMLGWCMIVLAGFVYFPPVLTGLTGLAIILLHNLTDVFHFQIERLFGSADEPNWLLKFVYFSGEVRVGAGGPPILILYVLIPWIGVMMAGYGYAAIVERNQAIRKRTSLYVGVLALGGFALLRWIDRYGDPRHWHDSPAAFAFLNVTKYPASLDFLLLTLGLTFILLSASESWNSAIARWVHVFGRVPMFFYLLHIPLIHVLACAVSRARIGRVVPWLWANHPLAAGHAPPGYRWSLGLLYCIYLACIAILYFPCRWYDLRRGRGPKWLSYL